MAKALPKHIIQKIRMEVLSGKSKYQVSREMDVSEYTVYSHTSDIPSINRKEPSIRGKKLQLLTQLLTDGYIIPTHKNREYLRALKQLLPMIRLSRANGRSVYYLDDRNKLALRSLMKMNQSRIISYQELKAISNIFGISLDSRDKQQLVRYKNNPLIIRKEEGGFLSSNRQSQTRLDDFQGKKPFLGKKPLPKNRKLQDTISDILREIEDSLVEFYIRKYCNKNLKRNQDELVSRELF
ncbi:MAG: hypothetical protein KKC68_02035 [Candidatus Thermoplasmatota archaeon]|nr:hypothetical protein [Candidatus Thermoplasmatota archaeon]MBU1940529.1 hypothetical protein [Candidatus Thermoplasmatota archaeon]